MIELANKSECDSKSLAAAPARSAIDENQWMRVEAQQALATFCAGIVHEINSPLGTALLSTQLALRSLKEDANPQTRRCLEWAVTTIQEAANTVREVIRQYSKTNAIRCQFDVRDVLRFTVMVMKAHAEKLGCELVWTIAREESLVFGNPLQLQVAIASLIYSVVAAKAHRIEFRTAASGDILEVQVDCDLADSSDESSDEAFIRELLADAGCTKCTPAGSARKRTIYFSFPKYNHD